MTDPADNSPPEAAAPQAPRPDPQAFQLRGNPPRVMRLSRKALAAIGVVASLAAEHLQRPRAELAQQHRRHLLL